MTAESRNSPSDSEDTVLRDYGITILIAVLFALLIRFFVVEAYRIPTPAMRPTLESGDTIFVGKWQFGLRLPLLDVRISAGNPPQRGEVILYAPPEDPKLDIIKRVIGMPGESVQVRQGKVSINGKPLEVTLSKNASCGSEKLPEGRSHETCWEPPTLEDFGPEKIPDGHVFVLSDLRSGPALEGSKSKAYAIIPITSLRGKALWTWMSIQPQTLEHSGLFPQFRFERMFRRIE